jgi:hypothetical protein
MNLYALTFTASEYRAAEVTKYIVAASVPAAIDRFHQWMEQELLSDFQILNIETRHTGVLI